MVSHGEYNGKPTIILGSETKYPFTFGIAKARLILAHLSEIQQFVANNPAPVRQPGNGNPVMNGGRR